MGEIIKKRAKEIFNDDLNKCQTKTAKLFLVLLSLEWIASILGAYFLTPYTWYGIKSSIHIHLYSAFILGGILCLGPALLYKVNSNSKITFYSICISQVLFSSLLIHLSGGRIETHFHVFGSLAFIAFFRDTKLLLTASLVVAIDHFVRGIFWPESVFGVLTASPWISFEHSAWVIFEDIFLFYSIKQHLFEMKDNSFKRAELESTNRIIELQVKSRTKELLIKSEELEKSRDHALKLAKTKTDFLANMSHEIRTPMNAIIGFSELIIENKILEKEDLDHINIISSSANHLLGLINDILDFSKVQEGKLKLESIPTDIRALIEETLRAFDSQLENKKINSILDIEKNIPKIVNTDPVRLRQVITNLFGNAIKFTPTEGAIAVKFIRGKESGDNLRISGSIIDTGIGIAKEKQKRIFDAFEQADLSQSRKFGGTGLGLSITEQILSLMNGNIDVRSSENIGTCFNFEFEVKKEEKEFKLGKKETTSLIKTIKERDLKILIAEDNIINQKLISKLIEKFGCNYKLANNGYEAFQKIKKENFNLILMDIQMPELNGIEATIKIRDYESEVASKNKIPIVALTAHALKDDRKKCLEIGMDDYLTKPIDVEELKKTIIKHTS